MHIDVRVIRLSNDGLGQEVWRFSYLDSRHALMLQSWTRGAKETSRHRVFRTSDSYEAHRRNYSAHPPIPEDVQKDAVAQFLEIMSAVKVGTWQT